MWSSTVCCIEFKLFWPILQYYSWPRCLGYQVRSSSQLVASPGEEELLWSSTFIYVFLSKLYVSSVSLYYLFDEFFVVTQLYNQDGRLLLACDEHIYVVPYVHERATLASSLGQRRNCIAPTILSVRNF